jgi:hypothetical protein
VSPFLNSRSARVTPCEAMRDDGVPSTRFMCDGVAVGATPKRQAVHSGAGAQTCSGRGVRKAERRSAAGRRKSPEAVTELVRNGIGRHASRTTHSTLPGDAIPRQTRSTFSPSDLGTKSRISRPVSHVFHSAWSRSRAHNKGVISYASPCPRRLCIAAPPIRIPSVLQSIGPALEFKPLRRRKPGRFPSSRSTGPRGCIPRR